MDPGKELSRRLARRKYSDFMAGRTKTLTMNCLRCHKRFRTRCLTVLCPDCHQEMDDSLDQQLSEASRDE